MRAASDADQPWLRPPLARLPSGTCSEAGSRCQLGVSLAASAAAAPRPRPSRRNAVYGGEHNDYHHRRHANDASNSEFIAANIVNAYKLEKARRKVDAALKAEDAADVVDTRSAEYHAQQPRTQKAKKDSQSAKVKGKREKPARQPFLRSEAQQEVALPLHFCTDSAVRWNEFLTGSMRGSDTGYKM